MKEKMKNLTLNEIEKYGSEVQADISESMSNLLRDTKCIDLGPTGNYLSELSNTSHDIKRMEDSNNKGIDYYLSMSKLEFLRSKYLELCEV